ncbi:plexin domain-containing protein 1 isoform X2 [Diprion similis]|uniref:plexin domain-containing protein 1 isoform X2 n=1 Tax=Diprion similis TaxID=362088 RepID=UPI001EF9381B|nr:plexin domain-containing protein 1 isoform X2 [Diprion similis]
MARESRWLFSSSCCCVHYSFVILVAASLGFSLVVSAADTSEDSYYRYRSANLVKRSALEVPVSLVLYNEPGTRVRRGTIEEPLVQNTTLGVTTTPSPKTTVKLNSGFENVAYSTDNNTKNPTSQPTSVGTSPVVVSQPLIPATGRSDDHPRVWPNATMRPIVLESPVNNTEVLATNVTQNMDDSLGDDININKFGDLTNTTLSQNNITKTQEDHHTYYNSTIFEDEVEGRKLWVDMDNHPNLVVNELLSASHRRAATVKLSFDFPFYGHNVRNVTIATGGFLYTGEYVHSWLAATQYIAPLMANFDTRLSNDSYVKYADNGTAFTVEWSNVALQEKQNVGNFTFQVTLHKSGDIVFVYAAIPLVIEDIADNLHPVKVGLSDAYIIDRTVFYVRRKTIYEYHRVNFKSQDIRNWTVIYLRALPTCLRMDNCNDCLNTSIDFKCKWCPILNRCSTGVDRYKQDWLMRRCEEQSITQEESCPVISSTATTYAEHEDHSHDDHNNTFDVPKIVHAANARGPLPTTDKMTMGVSGIIGILLVVSLIVGLIAWGGYAYRNPHSASGQVLIRYRPSQWSWRRGEARYTAATIHM